MKNKKWFTLTELLLALLIAWSLVWIILSIYMSVRAADQRMSSQRQLISEASDLIDRIHDAALYYTIDYEEYFNRQMLPPAQREFSSYGNDWTRYYCWWGLPLTPDNKYIVYTRDISSWWCSVYWKQKFWEYSFQFRKLNDINNLNSKQNSWSNMWFWPVAVSPNTWLEYLYLINYDNTERYYFRRYHKEWDLSDTWKNANLYTIQILRLKWLDAWIDQDFDSWWAYDWFIDTWVCDSNEWFDCHWKEVKLDDGKIYHMPYDGNDWWLDVTNDTVTVSDFRVDVYPVKDPYLAINEDEYLFSPYIKLSFTLNMYNNPSSEETTISTTLWFKNSYYKYPIEQYDWYIPEDAN